MKLRLMICAAAASTALFAGDNDATSATYAVMNVTNAYTDTIIAVPWVGLDGNTNTISGLVNTTTLAEGDKLYMYDNGTWYEYTKSEGVWTGATTITTSGDHTAESQVVARGSGLILQRASAGGTVLLCGRVDSNAIQTTIAANGKTLFANPTASDVLLNTTFKTGAEYGDKIMIPQNSGGTLTYMFNGTEWGSTNRVEDGTINVGNRTIKKYKNEWQPGGSIPAGTGAWYESKNSESRQINWQ